MSLQERTIVVRNFEPEKTTETLLRELCLQAGPVRKLVMRPDHAFVEYDDMNSVAYARALLDGVVMFGKKLSFEPKFPRLPEYQKYTKALNDYIAYDRNQRALEQQRQQQLQYQQMQMMMQQQQQQQHQQQIQLQQQQHHLGAPPQMYIPQPQIMPFTQYQQPPQRPPNGFYR